MSEDLFPLLGNDNEDAVADTAHNGSNSDSFGFEIQSVTSVTPSISEDFLLDGIHNENRKRSLSVASTTICKKVRKHIKESETKSEFSYAIFESDMQLQIDCHTNQTKPYPQDNNRYAENSTNISTNIYYPSTSFHSNKDINLETCVSDIPDVNVSNEFLHHTLNVSDSSLNQSQNYSSSEISKSKIDAIFNGLDDEANNVLEETAERNKLTATNIKNILRHVITNEYVLAMVRNTMRFNVDEEGEVEDAIYEPKLTRSKAKRLREKQATLPWPVSSPSKQYVQEKKILEEEFSDDENSSDEEYKPNKEEEEEGHSEEEEEETTSPKVDSTRSSNSDKSLNFSPEKALIWDLDPSLVEPETVLGSDENGLIALRTRSKLPLVGTTLETIESSFIAPDIAVDMYDSECDDEDWQNFLLEFTKPLDPNLSLEQPDDDGDDDPEYHALEVEDDDDDKPYAKISQKELNALMDAILETAGQELVDIEEEDEDDIHKEEIVNVNTVQPQTLVQSRQIFEKCSAIEVSNRITDFERLQLKEQMRMHVQLLTQSFLLSQGIKEISQMSNSSTTLLEEIGAFCTHDNILQRNSYFCADNLEEALAIVNASKAEKSILTTTPPKTGDKRLAIPYQAKTTIAHSKVFIYPHLLPAVGFCPSMEMKSKALFTDAEDLLLALGLEHFSPLGNPLHWIHTLLLPTKTVQQLKLRIKKSRHSKSSFNNPIKYYYSYGQAPAISRCLRPYDQANVKPPCEFPIDVLPKWMHSFVVKLPVLAPAPIVMVQPKVAVVQPLSLRLPERRKYQHILPRVSYISPFKKISPILRKYTQHRRIAPIVPFTSSPKLATLQYKSLPRMVPIKPKPPPITPKPPPIKLKPPPVTKTNLTPITVPPRFVPMKNLNIDATSVFVPPATTSVILNPKPIFVTTSQIIQNPEQSTVPPPILSTVEIVPTVCDNSSQGMEQEPPKEKIVIDSMQESHGGLHKSAKNDCDQNCVISIPEIKQFDNNYVNKSINVAFENAAIASVSSASESVHDHEIPLDLEVCDEVDDEAVNDEQDLAALMAASSTICKKQHSSIKKKNKHQRDLESTVQLLSPNILNADPKKEEREMIFAQTYLLRVMEALKNEPQNYEKFLKTLCSYENCSKSPLKLFAEVREILKSHPALVEEFIGFLSPEQAKECGKFLQYTTIGKIRILLRKMEIHFSSQPHHLQRILRTLGQLQNQEELSSFSVITALQPLLRNQSHLLEEFLQILPDEPPPEWLMTDFEEVRVPNNSDSEFSSCDSFEEIKMPDIKDPYGGKDCPCSCHSSTVDVRIQNKNRHCVNCGTKFIDGRVYMQTGKVLKPAQIMYQRSNPFSSYNNAENDSTEGTQHENPCQEAIIGDNIDVENAIDGKAIPSGMRVAPTEHSLTAIAENLTPTASIYPCEVIEDAVLPPVSNSSMSSIPSDFSGLQEAFALPTKCQTPFSIEMQKDSTKKSDESENISSKVSSANDSNESNLLSSKSRSESSPSSSVISSITNKTSSLSHCSSNWTRDQDKIILETCQKHGVSKESFIMAANTIHTKTASQVKERFIELIRCLEQHLKASRS